MKITAMSLIVSGVLDTRDVGTPRVSEAVWLNTSTSKNILRNARWSRESERRLYHLLPDLAGLSASITAVLQKAFSSLAIPGQREIDSLMRQQGQFDVEPTERSIDGGYESSVGNISPGDFNDDCVVHSSRQPDSVNNSNSQAKRNIETID